MPGTVRASQWEIWHAGNSHCESSGAANGWAFFDQTVVFVVQRNPESDR